MSKQRNCHCCVTGCPNTASLKPDHAFFSIPVDKRRDQWLSLIAREDLKEITRLSRSRRVCEEHFSRDVILLTNTRKTLKRTALPSRCLPSLEDYVEIKNETDESTSSTFVIDVTSKLTQTDNDRDNIEESKVGNTPNSTVEGLGTRDTFYNLCETYLTKDLVSLIKASDSLKFKNIMSNENDYLQFCFNLYQKSPQAYNFFQTVYKLPNCDVLLKQYVQIGTKVTDTILMTIKARVDKMSVKEKNCSLLIGSVKLKANLCYNIKEDKIYGFQEINGVQSSKPTTVALAVMIKGLYSKWKQLIGYVLVPQINNDVVQDWIETVIKQLFEIGLNVRILVSSTKDDWTNATVCDTPFFFVNDKKIYHIFDAPDLMNSVRDGMLLYNIHFQGKVAKFNDIVQFYNEDQKKKLPLVDQLTESHINPKNKEKHEVKYAIELLSKTVANGLWNYMYFGLVKDANIGTVEFISNMNNLFDVLNVSKGNRDGAKRKKAFYEKETSEHILKKLLFFFHDLKVINPKTFQDLTLSVKFIKGILITLNAITLLFDDLKTEGYSEPLTSNLHRKALDDYINKLASYIKRKPPKLTTLQFTMAFRKLFISNLKIFTQGGRTKGELPNFLAHTCQLDEKLAQTNCYLEDLRHVSLQPFIKISNPRTDRTTDNDNKIEKDDYDQIDTPETHSLMYVCGYLLMKSKKVHRNCRILKNYLGSVNDPSSLKNDGFKRFSRHMQNAEENLPAAPGDSFIQFVEEMDGKFVNAFTSKHLCQRIADSLYRDIEEISFTSPCPCFPKKYMINLFIRIKIFYMIRTNNTLFKTNRQSRKFLTVAKLL